MAQYAHRTAGGHPPEEKRRNVRDYRLALRSAAVHLATQPFSAAIQTIHALIEGLEAPSPFRTKPAGTRSPRKGSPIHPIGIHWREVPRALADIETALFQTGRIEPMSRAFLVHYELLRTHPFSDANGRLGRVVLSAMMSDLIGLPIVIDVTRPMRSAFSMYNRLLRETRGSDAYRRWIDLFVGLFLAETHQVQRLGAALGNLSPRLYFRLTRTVEQALRFIDDEGPSDEILAFALSSEEAPLRSFIGAMIG